MSSNPLESLEQAAARQLAALRVDESGFRAALAKHEPDGMRIVVRATEAVDFAHNNYLPRIDNDAPASVWTSDIEGMAKWLLSRTDGDFFSEHSDFAGLQGPYPEGDEVEFHVNGFWRNARTDEITQRPGEQPTPLEPPKELAKSSKKKGGKDKSDDDSEGIEGIEV